ncbi:dihydroxy-acid dehydratase [Clostridium sp. USBA 49]|uniref:dihydroxy-acid dehydratase n=1 Tax=Clostridium sp. USBA 49 TaxID=1881060 RepID=UPI00099A5ACE|nr:dihydroxy-acid dehydratase [Clostridium sp. USBA 49]SKA74094.1 dihydroxy-acid dehydratase [Clostridium sp. USBA 49]
MKRAIDKLEPFQRAISKAHLASAGVSLDALDNKPLIAVCNSWNEVCPGHEPLRQLAEEVKKGVREAGGEPIEFNTIAMCDGIAQGHLGMRYCLPHREIIADSVEAMVVGEGIFDGMVMLTACDKITPAMLQAAARINIPTIIVTSGPSVPEIAPSDSKKLRSKFLSGEITERELIEGTLKYYSGPGICPFLGTANTMNALAEALGMMLSGSSLIPSNTSFRRFAARNSGNEIMRLIKEGITPRKIITKEAIYNAIVLLTALGGSLNALLHLPALAAELGIELSWDEFAKVSSKTPLLCAIVPNGNQTVVDLHRAGGVPSVMRELKSLLNLDTITVDGKTIGEIISEAKEGDRNVIRAFDNPIQEADGIQILYGNLAPKGALVKTSAVPENQREFTGISIVFNSEEECHKAYKEGRIKSGHIVVVRYEGPKGGPGMRELHRVTEILKKIPNTAIITDGRFSGASGGLSVGYICPEAIEGGPIALVENGDTIKIDLKKGIIELKVSKEELELRKAKWNPIIKECGKGVLKRYSKEAGSALEGAILKV